MRFLHTSDWHLGRTFFGVSLLEDQAHILDQLVALATESRVDAVLLAGDVYDRSSPPADAVSLLDETLTRLVVHAGIPVVLIAGNHDSGERLGFGSRLLSARGLHVAGTEPRRVRLDDAHGSVDIVAVPFAEPAAVAARNPGMVLADHDAALRVDLASTPPDTEEAGTSDADDAGNPRSTVEKPGRSGLRRVAVAHAFVQGGSTSESERPLVMGNAALVRADCFDDFGYAALGHLHRPQRVGRDEVRYCGSLLKYSFDEATHRKSVSVVEMDKKGACTIEEVRLSPRRDVRVLEGSLEELLAAGRTDPSPGDFVMARLTDRGAILDAIGKLRSVYPNCLHVPRTEFFASRAESAEARADLRRQSEGELFELFFTEMTDEAPNETEAAAFRDALAAVRRAMHEAD